ncbi:MAG: hypothetical protein M4579_003512 [Chaenotheca gracillima]|nr:MAG: hypothetical protein M4579_003512 [Chaenotheca gracillima]
MASISIPYYADSTTLPADLPTIDEIEASEDVFCDQTGRRAVGVGPHFAVKNGVRIDLREGETMLFVQASTSVPVPHIYALFKDLISAKAYIIMERIPGKDLESEWSSLSETQKDAIAIKLKASFDELRGLQSAGAYCSVGKRPLLDNVFWNGDAADSIAGPFETEAEFNNAMIQKYTFNNLPQKKAGFYQQALPFVLTDHPPVFTHGDFQRKNVGLRNVPCYSDDELVGYEHEIVILDWEFAGWYPSYWEYSRAIFGCRWDDDWNSWVGKILDPYLNEWAWMEMLFGELWS